jgi:hypothetical protein
MKELADKTLAAGMALAVLAVAHNETHAVQDFKALLTNSPPTGRVIFTYATDKSSPKNYDAAWYYSDYTISSAPASSPKEGTSALGGTGRWNGRRWTCSFGNLTWYESEPKVAKEYRRSHPNVDPGQQVLNELLAMGIQNLVPSTVRWSSSTNFDAQLCNGLAAECGVALDLDGRVTNLVCVLPDIESTTSVTYAYTEDGGSGFLPGELTIQHIHRNRSVNTVRYSQLRWQIPLPKSDWPNFAPDHVFPMARALVFTNESLYARRGSNLLKLSPSHERAPENVFLKRSAIILAIILLGPLVFLLFKTSAKHSISDESK